MVATSRRLEQYIEARSKDPRPATELSLKEISFALQGSAHQHYAPASKLPYHNYEGHVKETTENVINLMKRAHRYGITVDENIVIPASALHDSHMADFSRLRGDFLYPEELSAAMAYSAARDLGSSHQHAYAIAMTILSTHAGFDPITTEQIVMRAADLSNVSGQYAVFNRNYDLIYEEVKLAVPTLRATDFLAKTVSILGQYGEIELHLTPEGYDEDGRSRWHMGTYHNLVRKITELHVEAKTRLSIDDNPLSPESTHAVLQVDTHDPANGLRLLVPNQNAAVVSLPDNSIDSADIHSADLRSLSEVGRLLRPGGNARITLRRTSVAGLGKALSESILKHSLRWADKGQIETTEHGTHHTSFSLTKNLPSPDQDGIFQSS